MKAGDRSRFRLVMAAVAAITLAGLAACSAPAGPATTPSASWVDPPWVAEQAAQREEYRAQLQSCLDGRGWHVTVDLNGGIVEPFTDATEFSRFESDKQACRVSMGYSADGLPATPDELKLQYEQLLDVRNCLIAHGLDMAEPSQSEDAWIDAAQTGAVDWAPYNDPAIDALPLDEQEELWTVVCPQPWSQK